MGWWLGRVVAGSSGGWWLSRVAESSGWVSFFLSFFLFFLFGKGTAVQSTSYQHPYELSCPVLVHRVCVRAYVEI